jgi:hypothetical protein
VVVGLLSLTFLVWAAGLFAVYVVLFAPGMD